MTDPTSAPLDDRVGPVLDKSALGDAVRRAILEQNPGADVLDRGGYVRVLAVAPCKLDPRGVEALLGAPFALPGDLERVMPAFRGRLTLDASGAVWARREPRP